MSEWWTYRPSDFLMFAPRTWWRLFELHNAALWPAQPLLVLAGLAWLAWLQRRWSSPDPTPLRVGAAALAAAWAFVGWAFMLERYAPINWVACGFAALFVAQAVGLAVLVATAGLQTAQSRVSRRLGAALVAWALLAHPMLAPLSGRPWSQAEVFGLAPDPTAIATLGLLLCADAQRRPARWLLRALWAVALAWCVLSAATLWTLGSAQGWVPLLAAALAVAAARIGRASPQPRVSPR